MTVDRRSVVIGAVAAAPISLGVAGTKSDPTFAVALANFIRAFLAFDAAVGEHCQAGEPESGPLADRVDATCAAATDARDALAETPARSIADAAAKLEALLLDGGARAGESGRIDPENTDAATVDGDQLGLLLADLRRLAAGGAA